MSHVVEPMTVVLRRAAMALALALSMPTLAVAEEAGGRTDKAPVAKRLKAKRPAVVIRRQKGYGFLPGYEPPPLLHESSPLPGWVERRYWDWGWRYGYGGPRFYRGQWNGGGFGPCWTQTPVGPVWNCGK